MGSINNNPVLVQIIAWPQTGGKPLSFIWTNDILVHRSINTSPDLDELNKYHI